MEVLDALIMGLLQGFTEYLPVSSSGHLEIANALLGVESESNLVFATAVHAATVLSTIVVLWREIWMLLKGLLAFKWNSETQYVAKIFLSMVPVLVIGLLFKDQVEALFGGSLIVVGCCLLVTASLLTYSYYAKPKIRENLSFKHAFIIGIAQAIAVLPGLSRSGSTIATGIILGNKKEEVAKFSFLMVLIPVIGIAFLDLIGGDFSVAESGIAPTSLLVGFLSAFIAGTIACKWMINLVKKGKLIWFAIYCAIIGVATVVLSLTPLNI